MEQTKSKAEQTGRQRGRVPGLSAGGERVKTTLLLDLDTVEWGKRQPGGLSALIRQLLRQAVTEGRGSNR